MKTGLSLFGVPLELHWSLLLLYALFIFQAKFLLGSILFVLIMLSVLVHEYAHVWVAKKVGVNTVKVLLFGLGAAAMVESMVRYPKKELKIALAGPVSSFILFVIFLPLGLIFKNFIFIYLFLVNLIMGVFNLLPIYPSDGGRILYDVLALFTSFRKALKISVITSWVFCLVGIAFCAIYKQPFMVLAFVFIMVFSLQQKKAVEKELNNY
jgi:Zn-dependent protease